MLTSSIIIAQTLIHLLEETAEALMQLVRQGKALYIGISNYNGEDTKK